MTAVDKDALQTSLEEIDHKISDLLANAYDTGFYSKGAESVPFGSDQYVVYMELLRSTINSRTAARQDLVRLYRNLGREIQRLGNIIDQFGA